MPKIIENLRQRLLEEARRQIEEAGYASMTIRSVAAACGVGVGTVYNYFPSKDALTAGFMLQDWTICMDSIQETSAQSDSPEPVLQCIHTQLRRFSANHRALFQDEAAAASFAGSFSKYHGLLRSQLASPLERFCTDEFTAQFIAEALLTWTMAGKEFDEIGPLVCKLF